MIKRWRVIRGQENLPWLFKTYVRLSLLSPLLAVHLLIVTLAYSSRGESDEIEARGSVWPFWLLSLLVLHGATIGWRIKSGEISARPGFRLELIGAARSPRAALKELLPNSPAVQTLPPESFFIHAYPYLNPSLKYAVAVASDYVRSEALSQAIESFDLKVCEMNSIFMGHSVKNCFLANYETMASVRHFATPAFGLLYEGRYRQSPQVTQALSAVGGLSSLVNALLSINNVLKLVELDSSIGWIDRAEFFWPKGVLQFVGSPEIPVLIAGQTAQQLVLWRQILPQVKQQLSGLEGVARAAQERLAPQDRSRVEAEIMGLRERVGVLERVPLYSALNPMR